MRFEKLGEDFLKVLELLKIPPVRTLPHINKTQNKGNFLDYYSSDIIHHAVNIFGPYNNEWNYELPESWNKIQIKHINLLHYKLRKAARFIYYKYFRKDLMKKL